MAFGDDATPLDVLGIGNAIVDVLSPTDDATLERHALPKGGDDADRRRPRRGAVRADGPRRRGLGRHRAPTPWPASRRWAGARRTSAGCATTSWADLHARHPRRRGATTAPRRRADGPGTARCLIMVTPDAQRTMLTYLGASVELGPEDIDADLVASADVTLPRGLPVGPAAGQGGLPHRDGRRPRRRAPGLVHALGPVLRRAPPRRVPRAGRRTRWTSCSPTSTRSRPSTRWATLDGRRGRGARPLRDRRDHPLRARLAGGDGGRGPRGAGGAGVARRGHHRGRRPVRGRLPVRAHPRRGRCPSAPGSARIAAAEVISHYGARPEVRLAGLLGA